LEFHGNEKYEPASQNAYYWTFGKQFALRESRYFCKVKGLDRCGDLTIAVFWGVGKKHPKYDQDDKGTSLILINTTKGQTGLEELCSKLFLGGTDLTTAVSGNPMLEISCNRRLLRNSFYRDL
jgi:hypothetical protein